MTEKNTLPQKWFYTLASLHLVFWSLVPYCVRHSLPVDTVESIAWGQQWQLGYDKHPFVAAWLTTGVYHLFGGSDLAVYVLAQLAVVLTFWLLWRFVRQFLPWRHALAGVCLLGGCAYYNIIAVKFNPTTLMTPLWVLCAVCFFKAILSQKVRDWLWVGVVAAVCLLTKYQSLFLFLVMFVFLLTQKQARKSFLRPGVYLSLLPFVLLLLPHLIWSYQHHFPEVGYLFAREDQTLPHGFWAIHFHYPLKNIGEQIGMLAGTLLLFIVLARSGRDPSLSIPSFERSFVTYFAFAPYAATLLYALFTGSYLYGKWCTPYFSFFGLFLIVSYRPMISSKIWRQFLIALGSVFFGLLLARYGYLELNTRYFTRGEPDSYFPAKILSDKLSAEWTERYHTPLRYIVGSHYLTAYIAVYGKTHPTPYMDGNAGQSPWFEEKALRKTGGVFAWWNKQRVACQKYWPYYVFKKRFPHLTEIQNLSYPILSPAPVPPHELCVAFLPPVH